MGIGMEKYTSMNNQLESAEFKSEPVDFNEESGQQPNKTATNNGMEGNPNEAQDEVLWEARTIHKTTWDNTQNRKTVVLARYFSCQRCSKRYRTQTAIEQHAETHRGVKTVNPVDKETQNCDQCGTVFTNNSKANVANLCDNCDQSSGDKFALKIQPFKCHSCDAIYDEMNDLLQHTCTQFFVRESDVSPHYNQGTSNSSVVTQKFRTIAPKELPKLQMKPKIRGIQVLTHNRPAESLTNSDDTILGGIYTCGVCSAQLKSKFRLRMHMVVHTGPHQCKRCDRRFNRECNLERHQKLHCNDRTKTTSKRDRTHGAIPVIFKCDLCDKQVTSKAGLQKHILTHTGERPYKCDCCGTSFSTKSALNSHKSKHDGLSEEKPFQCYMCEILLSSKDALEDHMTTHTGDKPFKCIQCDLSFAKRCNLAVHVTSRHTQGSQTERLKCELCEKLLKNKDTLRRHMNGHKTTKQYIRKQYGPNSGHKKSLRKSLRAQPQENSFRCNQCDLGFKTAHRMELHNKTSHKGAKPFECDQCDMRYPSNNSLIRHKNRSHNGERPYTCSICSKGLTSKSGFEEHMNIHTGERPFICDRCGSAFAKKTNLGRHIKTHSRDIHTNQAHVTPHEEIGPDSRMEINTD